MRKAFLWAALLALAACSHASILLTTPYSVTGPTGIAVAAATNATATSKTFNWLSNTACLTYSFGTVAVTGGIDQSFTPLANAPTVLLCLNLTSGAWAAGLSNGTPLQSGTLTGTQLTSAIAVYTGPSTACRDAADYFAMTTFLPGTQPDLWGSGDL